MPKHAIVMGGSVAGLCTAAALADVFERVTLLERDAEPRGLGARKGTPQGWHAHLLLNRGQRSLESLLPGLLDDLGERGSVRGDAGFDFRWYISGDWRPIFVKGLEVRLQTRHLLEARLREHVGRLPGVELRFGTAIDAPIYRAGDIEGVRLASGEELASDLVVDATGRGSKTPRWLESWGLRRPPRLGVKIGLTYVSGLFEAPQGVLPSHVRAVLINPRPPDLRRGAAAFRVEGGRWLVTLFGYHGERAPLELAGFREWAKTIASHEIADILAKAEPVDKLRSFGFPRQTRNCYEKLRRMPDRYVVIGDAVCSFDPVFGQGMSVAASEAVTLRDVLRRQGEELRVRAIQAAIAKVVEDPWQLATTEAYRWPETTGWKPPGARLRQAFTERVHARAAIDPELYSAFLDVVHLDKRPSSLFTPRVLKRVVFGGPVREREPVASELEGAREQPEPRPEAAEPATQLTAGID